MSKVDLEAAVAAAAKTVESWRSNINAISARIADANSRLTVAAESRRRVALDAQLGNADAIIEIAKARTDSASATSDLADLDQALADSKLKLIEAEKAAERARRALAQFEANILRRQRIDHADQIDQAIAVLDGLIQQYLKSGRRILDVDAPPPSLHGMVDFESVLGERRLRAAIPKSLERILQSPVHDEQPKESLAVTESRFWNLPPEQPEKAKAA